MLNNMMKKMIGGSAIFLGGAALILWGALGASFEARALSVTVDGSDAEWQVLANPNSIQLDIGMVGRNSDGLGQFAWRDHTVDERLDQKPADKEVDKEIDLCGFHVSGDTTNLYILAEYKDLTFGPGTDGVAQLRIAIDIDQDGTGSVSLGDDYETSVSLNARWEKLLITRFGSNNSDLLVWDEDFATSSIAGATHYFPGPPSFMEMSLPWASLGLSGPPQTPLRFTVTSGHSATDDTSWEATGSDAMDCITNYGDPGTSPVMSITELGDGVVDYFLDVWFEADGDAISPLLISEVVYDSTLTGGSDRLGEFVEIVNNTNFTIPLAGYKIGDEKDVFPQGIEEGMEELPSGSLGPGESVLIANNAATFLSMWGFLPDYAVDAAGEAVPETSNYALWSSGPFDLGNGGDEVLLLDPYDNVVDVIAFEFGVLWPGVINPFPQLGTSPDSGESIQRDPITQDTDNMKDDFTVLTDPSPGDNDAPEITVPAPQSLEENESLTLDAITVTDSDIASNDLVTTLTVSAGTIDLATTTGLTIAPPTNGVGETQVSFSASLSATNAALNGLVYTAPGAAGDQTLTIEVSDQGFTGNGGEQIGLETLMIMVNPSAVEDWMIFGP